MEFRHYLSELIDSFPLEQEYATILKQGWETYVTAFTHPSVSVDGKHYEIQEQYGDATLGKFLVQYFYGRFKHLGESPHGVKIVARLKIKYGSQQELSQIASELGFWKHIRITPTISSVVRKASILEDVFEAFIGATEEIINHYYLTLFGQVQYALGYQICYTILAYIFDQKAIALNYESLFDAKTRFKELCDTLVDIKVTYKSKKVTLEEDEKSEAREQDGAQGTQGGTPAGTQVDIWCEAQEETFLAGTASCTTKSKAEQLAAERALETFRRLGHSKAIPKEYELLERIN